MKSFLSFRKRAQLIRENSGSTGLTTTLRKAAAVFALFEIPHYVCGGYAVQEHGYPRYTNDLDIIVPDVKFAREKLYMNGFKANPGSSMTVTDRENKVEIDLLPGGGRVGPGPLTLPMPTKVSKEPQYLTLPHLINIKLSSYLGSKVGRARDMADVVELIKLNKLPRNYAVDSAVADTYHELWDGLDTESRR